MTRTCTPFLTTPLNLNSLSASSACSSFFDSSKGKSYVLCSVLDVAVFFHVILLHLSHFHLLSLYQSRCSEDLLKSKITALESQLQVCMKVRLTPNMYRTAAE